MAKYVGFKIGTVHEEQIISTYYCGGCGYPCTDHDSFCSECGGAFRQSDATNCDDYRRGFDDGYEVAKIDMDNMCESMRQLRMCLAAILDRGEAPARVMSDE